MFPGGNSSGVETNFKTNYISLDLIPSDPTTPPKRLHFARLGGKKDRLFNQINLRIITALYV